MSVILDPHTTKDKLHDKPKDEEVDYEGQINKPFDRFYKIMKNKRKDHLLVKDIDGRYWYFYDLESPFENKNYGN